MRPVRRFTVRPVLPETLTGLRTLAMNLRWTWDHPSQDLFRSIDPEAWEASGHDPLRLLNAIPAERLEALAVGEEFRLRLATAVGDLERYLSEPRWYQQLVNAPGSIAYFSPEFGVSEVLPQYSGGLGILAGDHLKSGSDIGAPLVGVGLFYRSGYFRQGLSPEGMQQESYPILNPHELPLELVTDTDGAPRLVTIPFPGATMHAQIWRAQIGRVPLLLLDADVDANEPAERIVTDRLYGGNTEHRLRQEILLGIGGVRALDICGITPEVFHTNEGHAGFLGLERVRRLMRDEGLTASVALEQVRVGTIFTTHTPVPAGIDRFPRELIERYFGAQAADLGITLDRILALGAEPGSDGSMFNMAVMGFRLAQRSNGVSRLHGEVSRKMFAKLWPGFDAEEVPIRHITNGVHSRTWVMRPFGEIYERHLGPDWRRPNASWEAIYGLPDEEIWNVRRELRRQLVEDIRARVRASWQSRGATESQLGWVARAFDPEILTIGFARRVPSYKRLTLILRDRDRLTRLLTDPERPIQLVVAGKAHPADEGGKRMIREFVEFAADPAVRQRVAFLPDYDMAMARKLYGADVWLNNPLRPYEACGTSGMKAALNGALNLSIRDGWWDELYDGRNGWAIPSGEDTLDAEQRDDYESDGMFDLLENEVLPLFYDRPDGIPRGWLGMVKHSMASLGPVVRAKRMVSDYTEQMYLPAARSSRELAADGFALAHQMADWKARVAAAWPAVAVRQVDTVAATFDRGDRVSVRAVVDLADLHPDEVETQVAYGRVDDAEQLRGVFCTALKPVERSDGGWVFEGEFPLQSAGSFGFTVRVVPHHHGVSDPAEMGLATWA